MTLLGAQRFQTRLREHVAALGVRGRICLITAGWQERESEDAELVAELCGDRLGNVANLHLHARGEQVFKGDPELAAAHRERQDALRDLQTLYRLRLDRALDAVHAVGHADVAPALREDARQGAITAVRALDAWHVAECARVRVEHDARLHPFDRTGVQRHRAEIAKLLGDCELVVIAGGHVAVLVNRLLMFGIPQLLGDRKVLAWSGGAMVVTPRVVLFHDSPPHGAGRCEVLDAGIGLVPGVVAFPEPEQRLHLDDRDRVSLSAGRFAPFRCLVLPAGSSASFEDDRLIAANGARLLTPEGLHVPILLGDDAAQGESGEGHSA